MLKKVTIISKQRTDKTEISFKNIDPVRETTLLLRNMSFLKIISTAIWKTIFSWHHHRKTLLTRQPFFETKRYLPHLCFFFQLKYSLERLYKYKSTVSPDLEESTGTYFWFRSDGLLVQPFSKLFGIGSSSRVWKQICLWEVRPSSWRAVKRVKTCLSLQNVIVRNRFSPTVRSLLRKVGMRPLPQHQHWSCKLLEFITKTSV